ncbi:MAG: DUF3791 domain-containing protein [Bacilli bacterium]|nr:DUF3791 domain-containing protein [Bacilli bacterium]
MQELIEIGKEIRQKRLSLNMTMEVVAKKSGITRATLWSIEKGTSNCSIQSLLRVLEALGLTINISNGGYSNRMRASRINSSLDKKINKFIIECIENYASYASISSGEAYKEMKEKGVLEQLKNGYEDLHGFSFAYLNDYISSLMKNT